MQLCYLDPRREGACGGALAPARSAVFAAAAVGASHGSLRPDTAAGVPGRPPADPASSWISSSAAQASFATPLLRQHALLARSLRSLDGAGPPSTHGLVLPVSLSKAVFNATSDSRHQVQLQAGSLGGS